MKMKVALALLALAITPALVGAQTVTPAPVTTPVAPTGGHMMRRPAGHWHTPSPQAKAAMKKIRDAQMATKAKMFGSLSAAHRAYVASVIGNLAISSKPNVKAAIAQIDATLTASEKTAVIDAHAAGMKQLRALGKELRDQMRAQWKASGASPLPMPSHRPMRRAHKARTPDAGAFLLQAAHGGGPGPGMMMRMGREHRPM